MGEPKKQVSKAKPPAENDRTPWLKAKAPALHKFLTRSDKPYPVVREVGFVVVAILLGAALLWGLTGQSFPDRPVVVIESASMMHCQGAMGQAQSGDSCKAVSYGRLGTVDPGDLVFVRAIGGAGDVETMAGAGRSHYGGPGDVVIYFPGGNRDATPVIHRAMFYLQINKDKSFTIPELGLEHITDLDIPQLRDYGLMSGYDTFLQQNAGPEQSGFITRGDNNQFADQRSIPGVDYPVAPSWILGKARGEIPWIGLVNLAFRQFLGGDPWFTRAPTDTKVMLAVVVAAIIATPWVVERVLSARREKQGLH